MSVEYPPGNTMSGFERMKLARKLLADEEAIKAAAEIGRTNPAMGGLMQRIIDACEAISDGDLPVESAEYKDLQEVGMAIYDIGGYLLMQLSCNHLAMRYAQNRTPKGNPYRFASLCNGAWNGIGEWVF